MSLSEFEKDYVRHMIDHKIEGAIAALVTTLDNHYPLLEHENRSDHCERFIADFKTNLARPWSNDSFNTGRFTHPKGI